MISVLVPLLDPIDFEAVRTKLENAQYNHTDEDVNAYCQYPKVFKDYEEFIKKYGDVSVLDTPTFFFGMTKTKKSRSLWMKAWSPSSNSST